MDESTGVRSSELESPPTSADLLTALPAMSWKRFLRELREDKLDQVCLLTDVDAVDEQCPVGVEPKSTMVERFASQSLDVMHREATLLPTLSTSSPMCSRIRSQPTYQRTAACGTRLISCRVRSTA